MDDETRKLNAIVGAAIRALAESGAEDEFVGSFAAAHRIKVAGILGQSESVPQAPDLLQLVTQAVGLALDQAGVNRRGMVRGSTAKRIYVVIAGKRTSLTLSRDVFEQLIKSKGDSRTAKMMVQDFANSVPPQIDNRSGWVEERLLSFLAMGDDAQPHASRH